MFAPGRLGRRLVPWVLGLALAMPASAAARAARGPKADPASAGFDAAKLAELRPRLTALIEAQQIAGAVTAVASAGKLGHVEVVGQRDREKQLPMTWDTIFRIASMTKIVTAVAVMMLEEEGKLRVEDPLEKHLPEFGGLRLDTSQTEGTRILVEPARKVTIQDLLTHTSGLRCSWPPAFEALPNLTLATLAAALSQHPLEAQPGTRWKYCGPPFDVLGRLVEVVSGQPFPVFLEKRIFGPLGMKDTGFELDRRQQSRLAVAYEKGEPAGLVPQAPRPARSVVYPSPSGGLYSTTADMLALGQMLAARGQAGKRRLLAAATVDKLARVHFTSDEKVGFTPGLGMGMGVQVVREPTGVTAMLSPGTFGHGGAHGTQLWIDTGRQMVLVLMIQRRGFGNGDASPIRQVFQETVVSALHPQTPGLQQAAHPTP